jgi:hypothetical protein
VWRWLVVLIILIMALLPVTPVLANSVNITVTAKPHVTGGITNFTIIYVSDTQLDFTWSLFGEATKIMIRGKYGGYPDNIPDPSTEPSDGYLVYYGDATSCSDTSMDFDENPGPIYYTAWAQKDDGMWYTDIQTGWKESAVLTTIAFIVLALGVSGVAIWRKHLLLYLAAFIGLILIAYHLFDTSVLLGIPLYLVSGYMLWEFVVWWF